MKVRRTRELFLSQETCHHHFVKKINAAKWTWEIKANNRQEFRISNTRIRISKKSTSPKEMHFFCSDGTSDQILANIRQYCNEFSALQSLALTFKYCSRTTQAGIYDLSEALKRLSSLEKLDLCFESDSSYGSSYLTDKTLGALSKGFGRLISLKTFRLTVCDYNPITDMAVQTICQGLRNLVFLSRLEFSLNVCGLITDGGMVEIKKLLMKLKSLRQVKFRFAWCRGISLNGIEQITQGLKPLYFSKNMTLTFYQDFCSIILANNTQDFQSEIFFLMKLWRPNMEDDFGALEDFIRKFPAIENLNFHPKNFAFDERVLKYLVQTWNNLALLQTKSFKLMIFDRMDEKEIECLVQFLKSLVNLNFVHLVFFKCSKIPEKALQYLSKGLAKHSPEKLCIRFVDCADPFENELEKIGLVLKNMTSLKMIEFDFIYNVSNSGIQKIVEGLNYLVILETVTCRFSGEHQITKIGLEKTIETLKNHQSLQTIKIYFGSDLEVIEGWREIDGKDKGGRLSGSDLRE